MSPAEAIFAIDVRTCMEGMLETRIIEKELCPLDYSFFMTQIQELSDRLRETQRKAMVGYYAVPERAQANPELIPQLQNPISQVFEFEERQIEIEERFFADMNRAMAKGRKMEPKVSFEEQRSNVKKRRLKYAVAAEQHRIALAYGQDIRKEVFNLTQLKWPSNEIGVH